MASYLDLLKNTTDGIPTFKQNSISELAYLDQVKAPKSFLQQVFGKLGDNYKEAMNAQRAQEIAADDIMSGRDLQGYNTYRTTLGSNGKFLTGSDYIRNKYTPLQLMVMGGANAIAKDAFTDPKNGVDVEADKLYVDNAKLDLQNSIRAGWKDPTTNMSKAQQFLFNNNGINYANRKKAVDYVAEQEAQRFIPLVHSALGQQALAQGVPLQDLLFNRPLVEEALLNAGIDPFFLKYDKFIDPFYEGIDKVVKAIPKAPGTEYNADTYQDNKNFSNDINSMRDRTTGRLLADKVLPLLSRRTPEQAQRIKTFALQEAYNNFNNDLYGLGVKDLSMQGLKSYVQEASAKDLQKFMKLTYKYKNEFNKWYGADSRDQFSSQEDIRQNIENWAYGAGKKDKYSLYRDKYYNLKDKIPIIKGKVLSEVGVGDSNYTNFVQKIKRMLHDSSNESSDFADYIYYNLSKSQDENDKALFKVLTEANPSKSTLGRVLYSNKHFLEEYLYPYLYKDVNRKQKALDEMGDKAKIPN